MLTPEQRTEIVRALKKCSNAAAVARSMEGVSAGMVRKLANKEGIPLRDGDAAKGSRDRVPAHQRDHILGLLQEIRNAAEVSRIYPHLSHTTISRMARRAGIALTASLAKGGGPHLSKQKRSEIVEAVRLDSNAVHVADRIGNVSATTVRRIANQQNIPLTAGLAVKLKLSIPAEKWASIVSSLKETPNAAAVARQVGGVSVAIVRRIAHREEIHLGLGKAVRRQPSQPFETKGEIVPALGLTSIGKPAGAPSP